VLAAVLIAVVLIGWTLTVVIPRYHVERHRDEGPGVLDIPTFLIGDCPYYRAIIVSLLQDHDLNVGDQLVAERLALSENVARGRHGQYYPKHPILLAVAALPFYVVAGDVGLLAFNLAQLAALVLVMWMGARRYASNEVALVVVLWYAFGTMLRPAAYNFAPDVLSTLLVAGAIVALLYGRAATAGLLLGLSLAAKWTNAVFVPVALGWLVVRRDWRQLARFCAAAAPPVAGVLALNWHMFGSPFVTPYDRVLLVENRRWVLQPSHRTFFTLGFWSGLWSQLSQPHDGLVAAAAPLLLALPGLVVMFRRARADALLIGAACVAQLAMFAKYAQWNVSSYGPRFHLSVIALSALPAAAAAAYIVEEARRRLRRDAGATP
jgi:hypothetical protein